MIIIYRILINIVLIFSPLIFLIRFFKKKEDLKSYKEKLCFFSEKKINGKLIWFHGASVGEFQSIVPLLEKLDKDKSIKQILITSNTLSSSKIIKKVIIKKLIHQFFPIDSMILSQKFLNYWKPSAAFFVDSEIWPNTINNLKQKKIPITLINARITNKSYNKWVSLGNFSKNLFYKFDLCLSSSEVSQKYLKKLGAKNIKMIGNLKFSQSEYEKIELNENYKKIISSKKVWCAASTHPTEEILCGLVHKKLRKKFKNLLTIIIPRHTDRVKEIYDQLISLNLKTIIRNSNKKILNNTDIYLVNTYGETKKFFNISKIVFIGGSIINHGGQNPIEPARFGLNILHGPNVQNFKDIYHLFNKSKIAHKFINTKQLINISDKLLMSKKNKKLNLVKMGNLILKRSVIEINKVLNYELKKT